MVDIFVSLVGKLMKERNLYKTRSLKVFVLSDKTKDVLNDGKYEYNGHVSIIR